MEQRDLLAYKIWYGWYLLGSRHLGKYCHCWPFSSRPMAHQIRRNFQQCQWASTWRGRLGACIFYQRRMQLFLMRAEQDFILNSVIKKEKHVAITCGSQFFQAVAIWFLFQRIQLENNPKKKEKKIQQCNFRPSFHLTFHFPFFFQLHVPSHLFFPFHVSASPICIYPWTQLLLAHKLELFSQH